jgi:regulator of sigma E protease
MEFLVKAGQFILSFSIIVILHELGHFLPSKWFKCRVEKFYLFFNPWFSLLRKKIGETEYGLGWIPFGGYVKIAGMIDESMDKEQMKQPAQSWEFRSKPAWQRLIIMVGGVTVNLILGFLIYAMMSWHWGDEYIPTDKLSYGIATDSLARSIGFRDGDQIVDVDGKYIDDFKKIPLKVLLYGSKAIRIKRDGKDSVIEVPADFAGKVIKYKAIGFISPRTQARIDSVVAGSTAANLGFRKGDHLVAVDGQSVYFNDVRKYVQSRKGQTVQLSYTRGRDTMNVSVLVPQNAILGFYYTLDFDQLDKKVIKYSFFESIPAGISKSYQTLESYWLQLKLIFSGKVNTNESLGSVISIGKMFAPVWDWQSFWQLTAFFSLALALMNILPIPGLDGGHVLFTLAEMVSGRKPSVRFMEYAQMAGMILLFGVMAYALGLDLFRLFK